MYRDSELREREGEREEERTMSFRKTEKKAKKSSTGGRGSGSGVSPPSSSLATVQQPASGAGNLPEGTRSKLWELFGQIEHEFENLYSENAARELETSQL